MERAAQLPALTAFALLCAWIGAAILVAAVVAPAAFAVLPTRTLAGALVGRVLPVLFWSGIVVGIVVGLATAAMSWTRPHRTAVLVAATCVVVACGIAQLVVTPRIEQIRAAVGGPMEALAPTDARRIVFGRLHGASVGLLGLAAVGAVVLAFLLARSLARPSSHELESSARPFAPIPTRESNHDG